MSVRQKSFVVVEEGAEGESGNGDNKDKNASSTASANKMFAKHSHHEDDDSSSSSSDDEDDSDDDGEGGKGADDDDEDAEKFDIDDTSTTVTRSNSPNSHGDGHNHIRRRSGQNTPRHANGAARRSSGPPSLLSSSLPRLTSISSAFASRSSDGQTNAHATSAASPHPDSLLNSPDRFGLQGPPLPPRAISERHLLSADFRLDEGRAVAFSPKKANQTTPDFHPKPPSAGAEASVSTSRRARDSESGQSRNKQSKPMTPFSAMIRDKTPQGLRESTGQYDPSRKSDHTSNQFDQTGSSTGGTALVVYGEDESDSDSTTGAGH